ncbi:bifunctional serine/threonine-protein kinase/formylglycine-generating enzyme family protein [Simiduia agarivorans]|uniref:Protein kinase n=1 Tax=Simiduia agarivorans (strain DSM 21679 / JCM 13881 / BCRC 17597 / SA1) TaxID=1117647 RepID=K4KGH3_SIMAS|nr:bifunctional serine/threonine-protein kinase/formylglycine-generating enzyme family protein [Simiduia agarivorans]AFU98086.1 protein kinase [Simiduia agarivorans SA1 = DSM 21679]
MDIEDKTRVVPSLADGRRQARSGKPDQVPADDATVFVGARVPVQESRSPNVVAKSITNLDKTVFSASAAISGQVPLAVSTEIPQSISTQATNKTLIKDRFELVNLLGSGGMGAVYRALDRRKVEANDSDPYLAVKLLNDDFRQHPDAFISLQREARKSQNLAHPNIVTVYDFDRDGDIVFMTMEYLDGTPLDKLIRQLAGKGLDKEQAEKILRDITSALIHAHSQRIVHSDFKPGNIFVTKTKGAKVFDFGIARAVAGGMQGQVGEKTLFDAGSLGALTPAYASLEMLKGEDPCQSDDVYALGCVAYELFAGRHPFNKLPADKAQAQKLRPKRIRGLTRRQWRALESALQFSRIQRTPDAAEFMRQFFGRSRALWLALTVSVLSASALGAAFVVQYREQAAVDAAYKAELEQQLQQELLVSRIADKQESLRRLLALGSLSVDWERDVRKELAEYGELTNDPVFEQEIRDGMAQKFLEAAKEYVAGGELENGERTIVRAEAWGSGEDKDYLALKAEVELGRTELVARLAAEQRAEEARIEAEQRAAARAEAQQKAREHAKKIDAVVSDLERQLRCGFSMSIDRDIAGSLATMKALDAKKSNQIRPVVASELHRCISGLARENPRRATPLLEQAQTLLPDQAMIAGLTIDYCGHLEPGSGGRGSRFVCADPMKNGDIGPSLVVVKGEGAQSIAISKYEVSWGDLKAWCDISGACQTRAEARFPVTNVSRAQVYQYLDWLSNQTGYQYRLPTYPEWFSAVSAGGEREAPDRNCYLKYGGIEKGGELVSATSGKANKYGLVNGVGNASEMVKDTVGLLAVGGSHLDAMSNCLATTKVNYDGGADPLVGFRLVREARR